MECCEPSWERRDASPSTPTPTLPKWQWAPSKVAYSVKNIQKNIS